VQGVSTFTEIASLERTCSQHLAELIIHGFSEAQAKFSKGRLAASKKTTPAAR
jgi:hypothetical protein